MSDNYFIQNTALSYLCVANLVTNLVTEYEREWRKTLETPCSSSSGHREAYLFKLSKNLQRRGLPGGSVVKNPPANAGDMGSVPSLGRSHVPWSSWARVPQLWNLCSGAQACSYWRPATTEGGMLQSPCSPTRDATAVRCPCTTTGE